MPDKTATHFLARKRLIAAAISACFVSAPAWSNPRAPQVVNGSASFNQAGNLLTVTNTNGTIINWNSFSIGANETTRFNQTSASSSVLNRVLANDPSVLLGTLSSNGKVWLVNPAGIMVGQGARIDVAGFIASTLNVRNEDFLAGRLNFGATPNAGSIQNFGQITTPSGGSVYLVAPSVTNNGIINAPNGEVILAAGQTVQIVDTGTPGVNVAITGAEGDATNLGQIISEAGRIGMAGVLVKNSGALDASSVVKEGGRIFLKASQRVEFGGAISATGTSGGSADISVDHSADPATPSAIVQTGTIDAQGASGAGGTVHITTDSILSTGTINADGATAGGTISVQATNRALSTSSAQYTASGTQGAGGDILVSANVSNYTSGSYSATGTIGGNLILAGNEIKLAGAQLNASGNNGGGTIDIGGLMHGAAGFSAQGITLVNATNVLTNSSTRFTADALQTGNGGQVVLWSDQAMRFSGNISARGGVLGGNGGKAEVSALTSLGYNGLTNLSATNGSNGTLLLDPRNISIVAGNGALSGAGAGGPYQEFLDPTPGAGEGFGGLQNLVLNSGNIAVASPLDSAFGVNSGAVYLYSPAGTLVSALVGTNAGDKVGSVTTGYTGYMSDYGGLTLFGNYNLLVSSSNWNGTAGAVTWMNGTTGMLTNGSVGGAIAASNSLVGPAAGDKVGISTSGSYDNSSIETLFNGNVVISSNNWGGGKGAVSWMNSASGLLSDGSKGGTVSSANSLVGSTAGDQVGSGGITQLTNYSTYWNYAVRSPLWGNGGVAANALGAVTWMNGSTGGLSTAATGGVLSSANSLVGSTAGDKVGTMTLTYIYYGTPYTSDSNGIVSLGGGSLVVTSNNWGSGGISANAFGAVTWMNGATGALSDATLGGTVSSANSLVGSASGDKVGTFTANYYYGPGESSGFVALANGNFLVRSPLWGSAGVANAGKGAVTWGSGTLGVTGAVSSANSIVGSATGDRVGAGVTDPYTADPGLVELPNGNYVVVSSQWNGGKGAVTWGNGSTGTSGAIATTASAGFAASLVGSGGGNFVGAQGIAVQTGGSNYVVQSPWFDSGGGSLVDSGASTWMNGSTGAFSDGTFGGVIATSNSLMGGFSYDNAGGVTKLNNGNFLAITPVWSGGSPSTGKGAVTWINGATGALSNGSTGGTISSGNSLLGSTGGDMYGVSITQLGNDNLIVKNTSWNSGGTAADAGAVTWMNGATGLLANGLTGGAISSANSVVGSITGDLAGSGSATNEITDGTTFWNYLVHSPDWGGANVSLAGKGAVTWMNGATGKLTDGSAGGAISSANSLVGSTAGDRIGYDGIVQLSDYSTFRNVLVRSSNWNNGGSTPGAGAVTWMSGATGKLADGSAGGAVSGSNSLIGTTNGDIVGAYPFYPLNNGNAVITNPYWSGKGATTWISGATGALSDSSLAGAITSSNSLIGGTAGDQVGYTLQTFYGNSNYVVGSNWSGAGALTWMNGATGKTSDAAGTISSANSLVGSTPGDLVGSSFVQELGNGKAVFTNQTWGGYKGAVTWMDPATGRLADGSLGGVVSATNSLVGSTPDVTSVSTGDRIGSGGITEITDGSTFSNYVVSSPFWVNGGTVLGAGAVTFGNGAAGTVGVISASNSLVGSAAGDSVGSGGITLVSNGTTFWNYVVRSYDWGGAGISQAGKGAVTWVNGQTGLLTTGTLGGVVSAANSLIGSSLGDRVGEANSSSSSGVRVLSNGNMLVRSEYWGNQFSALSWMNGATGALAGGAAGGVVSASNSLLGSAVGDNLGNGEVGVMELVGNGNWVITSPGWGGGGATNGIGAATWMNGATGRLADGSFGGVVSASNSLVGNAVGDTVGGDYFCDCSDPTGGITALSNGNYVVNSPDFGMRGSPAIIPATGAVAWANGMTGLVGLVTTSNSVFGVVSNVTELASQPGKVLVGSGTSNGGAGGVYLLGGATSAVSGPLFGDSPGVDATVGAGWIASTLGLGTNVVLQANNDITLAAASDIATSAGGAGGALTLQAGRSILLNSNITTDNGNFIAVAGDPGAIPAYKDTGTPVLSFGSGASLNVGSGTATLVAIGGNFVNNSGSATPISTAGSGRWLVYSTDPALDQRGGMSYDFKQYGLSYSAGYPYTGPGAGNGFIYSVAPVVTPGLTGVVSKTYDGTTTALLSSANFTATGAIDSDVAVVSGTGVYGDKNVSSGKLVTVSGLAVSALDSVGKPVYGYSIVVPSVSYSGGTITQRPLSTWIGGASGNWSVASNWDALPDLSNVLAVSIPSGTTVTYDAAAGTTNISSLTAAGLNIAGGALNIANSLTLSSSFSQTGGTLGDFGGGSSASITQASGDLNLPKITVANLSLNAPAGAITQSGRLAVLTLNTQSQGATTLTDPNNQATNRVDMTAGGPLSLWASGDLNLGAINAGANPVVIKAGGAIFQAPGTASATNIVASSADLSSIFGGASGNLAISSNTQITGALIATVGTGADFGGIRIKNTGAQPASVTLTDNALAGASVSFLNTGDITSTSGLTLKTLTGGDLALLSNGNITWDGGSLATPSGSVQISADGSLGVTGALSSPVDLALSSNVAINVSGSVVTGGTGTASFTAPSLTINGSVNSADDVGIVADTLNLGAGSSTGAAHDVIVAASNVTATNATVSAGHDISAAVTDDMRINGSGFTAGNDIYVNTLGATSTLYLNDTAGLAQASFLWAQAPSTIHLNYPAEASGGLVVDGVGVDPIKFVSTPGGSGLFYSASKVPATPGAGLDVVYGVATPGAPNTVAPTLFDAVIAAVTASTTKATSPVLLGTLGGGLGLTGSGGTLGSDQTVGGTEGSFGGGDKEDEDKNKKDEATGLKKEADKPTIKKLSTCS